LKTSAGSRPGGHFDCAGGELLIGGVRGSELARVYGTPLFAYDLDAIEFRWKALRAALPERFDIYYSVKANPSQAIVRTLLACGAGLEVASAGELHQALEAGCHPESILFAGPGKTEAELELAIRHGIGEIHIESVREAERIAAIATRTGRTVRVAVRVNPNQGAEGGGMRMGGRPAPFGIDEETLDEALDRILELSGLDLTGIHLFSGTQILDSEILLTQYGIGLDIARRVAQRLGNALRNIDFGGGLGIPYFAHERPLDLAAVARGVAEMVESISADPLLRDTRLIVEPGRYLVGEAGVYVCRVNDVKASRGKLFVIADGGMHHHLAASGNLGQTIKRNYPVAILNKLMEDATEVVDIVGPLCTPLDVIARGIAVPPPAIGDLVGVFQSGAYARSASPLGFLSHATPPEVAVRGGAHQLIRRRGEYADFLRDQAVTTEEPALSGRAVARGR
jgi:diaminopimelate decarboxylase